MQTEKEIEVAAKAHSQMEAAFLRELMELLGRYSAKLETRFDCILRIPYTIVRIPPYAERKEETAIRLGGQYPEETSHG